MGQNISTAVMARRHEAPDSLDFFPTPWWATRALCAHVIPHVFTDVHQSLLAWDPCCGEGDMAKPLAEYFAAVIASDVFDYGRGYDVADFLWPGAPRHRPNWLVFNPPFVLAEEFVTKALDLATHGVAIFVRTAFIEGQERYRFYSRQPPKGVYQFAERVALVKGRLDRYASSATAYCWIVWEKGETDSRMRWIPPCRLTLERDSDWPAIEDATEATPLGV